MIDGKEKAPLLDSMAKNRDPGALELIVLEIPEFGLSTFSLEAKGGLLSIDASDLALALLPTSLSNGESENKEKKKAKN